MFDGMSDEAIRHAMRIVQSHSFNVRAIEGGVSIQIAYSVDGMSAGCTWFDCYSYREVFATLGY